MAYVFILVLLMFLTVLGLAFAYRASVEASVVLARGQNLSAHYLAEAAANHAMWRLLNQPGFPADTDVYYMHDLGDGRYGYKVRRHTDNTFATVAVVGAVGEAVARQAYVLYVQPSPTVYLSTADSATLAGLAFMNEDIVEYDDGSATMHIDGSSVFTGNEDTDAIHILNNGNIMLSTSGSATLGGLGFDDEDIVEYDPVADSATLYLDGSAIFSGDEDIDAACLLPNGHILLSTDGAATIGGLSFNDEDLVEYDPVARTATLYLDGSAIFSNDEDIDAVSVLIDGRIVLSTVGSATIGSRSFGEEDLIEYDPLSGTTSQLFNGQALFAQTNENVNAVHIVERGVRYIDFTEAVANAGGTSITLATPAAAIEDSLLVAAIAVDGDRSGSLAPPGGEGWTLISLGDYGGGATLGVWWTLADAAESATHQFTWTGASNAYGWMMQFEGHHTTAPVDVSSAGGETALDPASPSATSTVGYALVLRLGAFDDNDIRIDIPGLSGHAPITMDTSEDFVLKDELVGWWQFDDGSGTTAADSSGFSADGTLMDMDPGTDWVAGQLEGALDFDGANDRVATALPANTATNLTLSAWFNSDDGPAVGNDFVAQRIISQPRSGTFSRLALGLNNGRLAAFWYDGWFYVGEGTTDILASEWYHAALTYDGSDIRIYLNGTEEDSFSESSMSSPSTDNFFIGQEINGDRRFDGRIDDARIYGRALDAGEVSALYASGIQGVTYHEFTEAKTEGAINTSTIESTTVSKQTSDSTTFAMDMPATRPDGDLYIAQITKENDGQITSVPSGWTEVENNASAGSVRFATYYRIGSSEPSSYTWAALESKKWVGAIHRIRDVDNGTPIDASADDTGNTDTPMAPAVTTTSDDALVLRVYGAVGNEQAGVYWPGGTTGIWQDDADTAVVGAAAYATQATAGDSGAAAFTMTGLRRWIATTIAITPSPPSGTPSVTIPTPAGVGEGNLLVAAVAVDGDASASLAAPAGEGWNTIDVDGYSNEVTLGAWWKNAGASESSSHEFAWSGQVPAYGWMMRFSGHDSISPIDVFSGAEETSATPASPGVSTTADDTLVLRLGVFDGDSITRDDPGLGGHTAITMDNSAFREGEVNYEEFSEAKLTSDGTSLTINTPGGTNENDLLIVAIITQANETISAPGGEGWNLIDHGSGSNQVTLGVWWKLAGAGESPSHQFTWGSNEQAYGFIMRFTGHDTAGPIDASDVQGSSFDDTPPSPSVTTTVADTLIVRIGAFDDDDVTIDSTGLAGHTTITMDESNSGTGTCSGGAGYMHQAGVGSSGSVNFQLTALGEQNRAVTLAIAPDTSAVTAAVSGGAGYVQQAGAGPSGASAFALTASEEARMLTIGVAPDSGRPVSGGAGYIHQITAGATGTSDFSLIAPEESRTVTVVVAPGDG